ncbi:MAG: hypothetical protein QXJ28_01135 [Candidatus Pacearchaeota archaeon]
MTEKKIEEKKETKTGSNSGKVNIIKKIPKHNWAIATYILGIISIILIVALVMGYNSGVGMTGKTISAGRMKVLADNFINTQLAAGGLEIADVKEESGIYVVNVDYEGEMIPLYFTKDGKFISQGQRLISITNLTAPASTNSQDSSATIPKSDRPKVQLFIWSYCPYGVQAQKPFAEVAKLLKSKADFDVLLYYGGHGEYEVQQNKIQACIQKLEKDKYWDYAIKFVDTIYTKCGSSRDVQCDKNESVKLMNTLGINPVKIMECVNKEGDQLVQSHYNLAVSSGVSGSPTMMINGVKANTARNAEAFKSAICDAFNSAPSECNKTLSSTTSTASGSC